MARSISALLASKWGVNGLMKTLAMELGQFGVRANSICPGAVEGPRMEAVLAREAALKSTTRDIIYRGYAAGTSMRSFIAATDVAAFATESLMCSRSVTSSMPR
jgi:NAD(P)-dependent dehydrogenase (short-subunit alcohol dehydrogenase family)